VEDQGDEQGIAIIRRITREQSPAEDHSYNSDIHGIAVKSVEILNHEMLWRIPRRKGASTSTVERND
jgi:hypothetical protein